MDCSISSIIVILDKRWEDRLSDAVEMLKKEGMQIERADDDNSVIEGTIDASKVLDLKKMDCVDYVRTIYTYSAEFPPGDPRDTNGI